ncbi:DUF567-domain-containing protein [Nemania serpens]|nr:DUF567-domain-containing protein [Nemania serpens]
MAQLPPYPTRLGFFQPFMARQHETLALQEKAMSLSGDSFDIKMANGQPIFHVKGDSFSLSNRQHFCDMAGNELFAIRKKHLALHSTYYAEDPNGNVLFEVRSKFHIGGSKMICTFQDKTLIVQGNFFDTTAEITDEATKQPIAVIDRKFFNAREFFTGQDAYAVTVAPNVDMALIAAMCICMDNKKEEAQGA